MSTEPSAAEQAIACQKLQEAFHQLNRTIECCVDSDVALWVAVRSAFAQVRATNQLLLEKGLITNFELLVATTRELEKEIRLVKKHSKHDN